MEIMILAPVTGILVLAYVGLSVRISLLRRKAHAPLGDVADDTFQRAVRAQANFGEYTPLALLLLWVFAILHFSMLFINILSLMLLIGRACHAYSLLIDEPKHGRFRFRMAGMGLTLSVLGVSGLIYIVAWIQAVIAGQ